MKTFFVLLLELILAVSPIHAYAKGFKGSRSHVYTTTRPDGSKSTLVGPYDPAQRKGIQNTKVLPNGQQLKAHSHFVKDKDGKLMYSRIVPPNQKIARNIRGHQGIVMKDDKGQSNLGLAVFGPKGSPPIQAKQ